MNPEQKNRSTLLLGLAAAAVLAYLFLPSPFDDPLRGHQRNENQDASRQPPAASIDQADSDGQRTTIDISSNSSAIDVVIYSAESPIGEDGRILCTTSMGESTQLRVRSGVAAIPAEELDHWRGDALVAWFVPDLGFASRIRTIEFHQALNEAPAKLLAFLGAPSELAIQVQDLSGQGVPRAHIDSIRVPYGERNGFSCDPSGFWNGVVYGSPPVQLRVSANGYGSRIITLDTQAQAGGALVIQLGRLLASGVVMDRREDGVLGSTNQVSGQYGNPNLLMSDRRLLRTMEDRAALNREFEEVQWSVIVETRDWLDLETSVRSVRWGSPQGKFDEVRMEVPYVHVTDPNLTPHRLPQRESRVEQWPLDLVLRGGEEQAAVPPSMLSLLWAPVGTNPEVSETYRVAKYVAGTDPPVYRAFAPEGHYSLRSVPHTHEDYDEQSAAVIDGVTSVSVVGGVSPPASAILRLQEGAFFCEYLLEDEAGMPMATSLFLRSVSTSAEASTLFVPQFEGPSPSRFFHRDQEYELLLADEVGSSVVQPTGERVRLAPPVAGALMRIPWSGRARQSGLEAYK